MICPDCLGKKYIKVFSNRIDHIKCNFCDGKGSVSYEVKKWMEEGEILKKERLERKLTLRDASILLGLNVVELSDMERGKLKPKNIQYIKELYNVKKTLVIGDSWASAIESDTGRDAGWPEILGVEHRLGIRGSTAEQWANDFNGCLTCAKKTDTDSVIISLLGNDALSVMSDGQLTMDEIFNGLKNMRTVISTIKRSTTIVILYADPFFGEQEKTRTGVPLLNGAIQLACIGLPVIFANTGDWLDRNCFDGSDIHPTRKGHVVIANKMLDLIVGAKLNNY